MVHFMLTRYLPTYYIYVAIIIGVIPFGFITLKFTGYLNKIILNTTEMTKGNLGEDLPIKGKSHIAILASNINQLKHGVKTSLSEQAKSERLKTGLITNVSHDLRTPLTSIITYTELLKQPNLSDAERSDYVEVIDRNLKDLSY